MASPQSRSFLMAFPFPNQGGWGGGADSKNIPKMSCRISCRMSPNAPLQPKSCRFQFPNVGERGVHSATDVHSVHSGMTFGNHFQHSAHSVPIRQHSGTKIATFRILSHICASQPIFSQGCGCRAGYHARLACDGFTFAWTPIRGHAQAPGM